MSILFCSLDFMRSVIFGCLVCEWQKGYTPAALGEICLVC